MTAFVYEIACAAGRYVGITIKRPEQRWSQHRHAAFKKNSKTHLHRAMRKYGEAAFEFKVLLELPSAQAAKETEIRLIAETQPRFNMTSGGDGAAGVEYSPETRARMSASARRKPPVSAETRARMAAGQLKSAAAAANRARNAAKVRGKPLSESHRAKIAEAARKRYQSAAEREAQRLRSLGRKHSPETKAKISAKAKARAAAKKEKK